VAVIGANGCGKSTLLKVLDGLVFPDAGTFEAFGQAITEDGLEDQQLSRGFRSRSASSSRAPTPRCSRRPSARAAFGPLNMGLAQDEGGAGRRHTRPPGDHGPGRRAPFQLSGGQKASDAPVLVMNPECCCSTN
jgi:cobalt/nickel transport system ATP-binding protein